MQKHKSLCAIFNWHIFFVLTLIIVHLWKQMKNSLPSYKELSQLTQCYCMRVSLQCQHSPEDWPCKDSSDVCFMSLELPKHNYSMNQVHCSFAIFTLRVSALPPFRQQLQLVWQRKSLWRRNHCIVIVKQDDSTFCLWMSLSSNICIFISKVNLSANSSVYDPLSINHHPVKWIRFTFTQFLDFVSYLSNISHSCMWIRTGELPILSDP